MCLTWCTPPGWCLSRSKVNKGLPSPSLLATSPSYWPRFWYRPVSSSSLYIPPDSLFSFLVSLSSLSSSCLPIYLFPVLLPRSCLHSPLLYLFQIPIPPHGFPGSPRSSCFLSPSPLKGADPTHPTLLCSSSPPWASLGPSLPKHACLPACLSCALVCACVLKGLGTRRTVHL